MKKIETPTIKYDSAENWAKAKNYIPEKGTIIVYDVDDIDAPPRIKFGDGESKVNDLPFAAATQFKVDDDLLTVL